MKSLGISIYPTKSSVKQMKQYLDQAARYGCCRVFTSLLEVTDSVDTIIATFREIHCYAKEKGFTIVVDVSPRLFEQLHIGYHDLSFFYELGADGLRLDMGFTGNEEALMTFNSYGLVIETNMSLDVHTIDTIMDYQPNRHALWGCHNFYPHRYSGLTVPFFKKCSERFRRYGLRTAAFVGSQQPNAFGPWPTCEGLVTLECHRELPLDVQVKHHILLDAVDDVLIANCYPSVEEWQALARLDLTTVTFDATCVPDLPETEKDILFKSLHVNRGDQGAHLIRSTQSRVRYKGHHFKVFHAPTHIKRGDIIIESSAYGHYAGELQIALTDMKNSGKSNVVGRVRAVEHFLLDALQPWQKFRLRQVD